MAQQNDGQFDPVLFGDYRDPQDNLMNSAFGDFFNDAFPSQDFASPYNTGDVTSPSMKKDLIQEIEVRQDGEPVKEQNGQYVGCDKLWYVSPIQLALQPTNPELQAPHPKFRESSIW